MFAEVMMLDSILRRWQEQPELPKKGYTSIIAWQDESEANELPPSEEEVTRMKARMKQIAPTAYFHIFPAEREVKKDSFSGITPGQ